MPPHSDASGSPEIGFRGFRLAHLPVSARLGITCFIALIGFGYLTSLGHLFFTYNMADGKPGLTADDLRTALGGSRERTMLEQKVDGGSMSQYLTNSKERKLVLSWAHAGAKEDDFAPVHAILKKNCVGCHNPKGVMSRQPLTNFAQVSQVTQADRGESTPAWARVAHIHLQSLSIIYLALGLLLAFTGLPEMVKRLLIPLPFIALVSDFGARGLVSTWPDLVYLVMIGGGLGGFSTAALIILLFAELWFARPGGRSTAPATPRIAPSSNVPAGAE